MATITVNNMDEAITLTDEHLSQVNGGEIYIKFDDVNGVATTTTKSRTSNGNITLKRG